jgi:hypothetical protein
MSKARVGVPVRSNVSRPSNNGDGLPPHSPEAEAGALGCLLLTQSAAETDALLLQIRPTWLYDVRHRKLYDELWALREENHAPDMLVLLDWLKGRGTLQACGGAEYVVALPDQTPSVANFTAYTDVLQQHWLRRWCLAKTSRLKELAEGGVTAGDLKKEFQELLEATERIDAGNRPLIQLWTIEDAKAYQPDPRTFLIGADMISRGEISVIAGWPGLGKSRLSTTLAVAGARGKGEWMGYLVQRQFRTLILQAQNSCRRIKSEVEDLPPAFNDWIRFSKPTALRFSDPAFRAELRRIYDTWPFDVLVLDPWNVIAKDEGQADYLEALDNINAALPEGDEKPAVVVVAHLRKQRGGDSWKPKVGRELLNELAGSFALGAEARTVFVVQPASMEIDDDKLVFDCAKSNNDQPLPASCWYRRNGEFTPCTEFDLDAWLNPPDEGGRRAITEEYLADLWRREGPTLSRNEAVALLKADGHSQATAYRAIALEGKFKDRLFVTENGRLGWRAA